MNILDNNNPCTGCGACAAICPKHAITMSLNENGNLVPKVGDSCIDCGLCTKVCAKYGIENTKDIRMGTLYAVKAKDNNFALSCTSSGVSTKIAEYGIDNGYYVVGVQYNYDKNIAETIIVDDKEGVERLKKSKYLQAYTMPAYDELIKLAKSKEGNKFIVFGMPCQINGIASVVERLHLKNEFIYIDFFCHGVPSYLTWNKYIEERKKKYKFDKVEDVCFRDKKEGWHNYVLTINDISQIHVYDDFYTAFFDNLLLNESCYDCNAREGHTKSDIRLGDFWGAKYRKNTVGVSACITMTPMGAKLLDDIREYFVVDKEDDINECLETQSLSAYSNKKLHDVSMAYLREDIPLKKVISKYSKHLGFKVRVKKIAKKMIYKLPRNIRNKIREKI